MNELAERIGNHFINIYNKFDILKKNLIIIILKLIK